MRVGRKTAKYLVLNLGEQGKGAAAPGNGDLPAVGGDGPGAVDMWLYDRENEKDAINLAKYEEGEHHLADIYIDNFETLEEAKEFMDEEV